MDRNAVVKVGAMASATMCALFGGVVVAQYIFTKKQRAGKKTKIIEMVSAHIFKFLEWLSHPVYPAHKIRTFPRLSSSKS